LFQKPGIRTRERKIYCRRCKSRSGHYEMPGIVWTRMHGKIYWRVNCILEQWQKKRRLLSNCV